MTEGIDRFILFVDTSDSVRLVERLGDTESRVILSRLLDRLTQIAFRNEGAVVKVMGDGVLCVFTSPETGLSAARSMQEVTTEEHFRKAGVTVRVGGISGPVLMSGAEVFGDTVNVASRLCDLAKPGEIVTTQDTIDRATLTGPVLTQRYGLIQVKGRRKPLQVVAVMWERNLKDLTDVITKWDVKEVRILRLKYGDNCLEIRSDGGVQRVGVGRAADNLFTVDTSTASRRHAHVLLRNGQFYIRDNSTNGTYVKSGSGDEVVLHREEMLLTGEGYLGLGRSVSGRGAAAVHYNVLVVGPEIWKVPRR